MTSTTTHKWATSPSWSSESSPCSASRSSSTTSTSPCGTTQTVSAAGLQRRSRLQKAAARARKVQPCYSLSAGRERLKAALRAPLCSCRPPQVHGSPGVFVLVRLLPWHQGWCAFHPLRRHRQQAGHQEAPRDHLATPGHSGSHWLILNDRGGPRQAKNTAPTSSGLITHSAFSAVAEVLSPPPLTLYVCVFCACSSATGAT